MNRVPFVPSSGETSNFWLEDLEQVLQLEMLDSRNSYSTFFLDVSINTPC